MSVEDRVRAATRATADTVRDVRPLDLPEESPLRLPRPRWGRRGAMWMAPVTAAAVVTALALALVSVRDARHTPSAPAAPPPVSYAAAAASPDYYVALDDPNGTAYRGSGPGHSPGTLNLVVGETRTGKRLATIRPPKGETFGGVTGAADDRTFAIAAWRFPYQEGAFSAGPVAWYLLRVAPGSGHPATLTRLPVPGLPAGTMVDGIALSPDGRALAVMFDRAVPLRSHVKPATLLRVYSLSSGKALRAWTGPAVGLGTYWGRYSNSSVSWLADGHTLAFDTGDLGGVNSPPLAGVFLNVTVRTLDLARPGHDLLADSKVALRFTPADPRPRCDTLQLTADGRTVLCGTQAGTGTAEPASVPEFVDYSLATGKGRVAYRLKGTWALAIADVLWASPDGGTLIGSLYATTVPPWSDKGGGSTGYVNAGVITRGTFRPLRFPLHDGIPFAGEIAF